MIWKNVTQYYTRRFDPHCQDQPHKKERNKNDEKGNGKRKLTNNEIMKIIQPNYKAKRENEKKYGTNTWHNYTKGGIHGGTAVACLIACLWTQVRIPANPYGFSCYMVYVT